MRVNIKSYNILYFFLILNEMILIVDNKNKYNSVIKIDNFKYYVIVHKHVSMPHIITIQKFK